MELKIDSTSETEIKSFIKGYHTNKYYGNRL